MKLSASAVSLVAFLLVVAGIAKEINISGQGGGVIFLTSLGNVEGKSYFYDHGDVVKNWTEADQYCEAFGMQLATIMTEGQLQFLDSRYNASGFSNGYWVGLRNSREPLATLVWDDTESLLSNFTSLGYVAQTNATYLCGIYRTRPSNRIEMWPCTALGSQVLCETY